ncbi:hypothetical protein MAPG_11130 [Magnaporthiopsis poae ATCC 64411]|uniref:Uncharacterized protein n=1 Tax=Magnaporthiopsis poae (strain ATCC 64411 / 73-15) TaxID=644358 RepID=A0A0C4EEF7_MAGP6|nr:hypothetical protein MAPG_11130 [Magnaporthiopsis poae ATCC 64411]
MRRGAERRSWRTIDCCCADDACTTIGGSGKEPQIALLECRGRHHSCVYRPMRADWRSVAPSETPPLSSAFRDCSCHGACLKPAGWLAQREEWQKKPSVNVVRSIGRWDVSLAVNRPGLTEHTMDGKSVTAKQSSIYSRVLSRRPAARRSASGRSGQQRQGERNAP